MSRLPVPRVLLAALAVLAAIALAACGGDDSSPAVGAGESELVQEGTPVEHIHGLGINPAGALLAAEAS